MIDVVLITLNDEKNIAKMCSSILDSELSRLIVVDGGSTDQTLAIASKYTEYTYLSQPGMAHQTCIGLSHVDTDYVFLAEADHIYPLNFLQDLLSELLETDWDGIQGTLTVTSPRTLWEYCHKLFYYIHQRNKGLRSIIECPQLWKTSSFKALMEHVEGGQTYCFDTQRAESAQALGLKVGLGSTLAYEDQPIDFSKFLKRHLSYGHGDYDFYTSNSKNWTMSRKIKSLTHVFIRYGIKYPLLSIKYRVNPVVIPYLLLIMLVRNAGFFLAFFNRL